MSVAFLHDPPVVPEQRSGLVDHTQLRWALFHLDRWYEAHLGLSPGVLCASPQRAASESA